MANDWFERKSISEVLRASAILWVKIDDLKTGPWQASADQLWQICQATISLQLEKVLKGEVKQQPGERIILLVTLRDSLRPQGDPGPWSRLPLSIDQQLVAFCEGETDDARLLLTEDHCQELLPTETALKNVQRAMALERGRRSVSRILEEAQLKADDLGDIFARYVWAKVLPRGYEALFQAAGLTPLTGTQTPSFERKVAAAGQVFTSLMELLAAAETNERARAAYLACAMNTVNLMNPPPWSWEVQLIRALFKLLALPQAAALHAAVGQVYLPNLLGLHDPASRYLPEEVFADSEKEADQYLTTLKQLQVKPPLIEWLERKD